MLLPLFCCCENSQDNGLVGGWQFTNGGMYWEMYIQPDTVYLFNSEQWMIVDVSYKVENNYLVLEKYDQRILNGEITNVTDDKIVVNDRVNRVPITMSRISGSSSALEDEESFERFLSSFQERNLIFTAQ